MNRSVHLKRPTFVVWAGMSAVALFASVPLQAQVSGATLSGTATGPSGAVVPNAKISIKAVATGGWWKPRATGRLHTVRALSLGSTKNPLQRKGSAPRSRMLRSPPKPGKR